MSASKHLNGFCEAAGQLIAASNKMLSDVLNDDQWTFETINHRHYRECLSQAVMEAHNLPGAPVLLKELLSFSVCIESIWKDQRGARGAIFDRGSELEGYWNGLETLAGIVDHGERPKRLPSTREWSNFRTPSEWRNLREEVGLAHSESNWRGLRRKHPSDIVGEPGNEDNKARISIGLASEWGLLLPEFA